MKKFVLFIFLFCLMLPIKVSATELPQEETVEETVIEVVDEVTEDEVPETSTELIETLDKIHETLIAIEFTAIFYIMIHYTEKWRKVLMEIPRK